MFKIILPKFNLKIERWKWNKEYRVYVSTLGHIKNEYKQNMPIKICQSGYCNVLTDYGFKLIHRLVMLTFRPIPNAENLTVDHLNHNKRDNSLNNLEWVTEKENLRRAQQDLLLNEKESPIKFISNIDKEVNKIIKTITSEGRPSKIKIKNRILKSINEGTSYNGYRYKMKGEK